MTRRLIAIAFIYACTAVAWMILGSTITSRTRSADTALSGRVGSNWGTSQSQQSPTAYVEKSELRVVPVTDSPPQGDSRAVVARTRTETVRTKVPLPLEQTRATVAFDLTHRQKGLLWYSTYAVNFAGSYRFQNNSAIDSVVAQFRLPAAEAMYDDLRVTVNGVASPYQIADQSIVTNIRVPAGDSVDVGVAYRSQGLDDWHYVLGGGVTAIHDFQLVMHTNFADIDFPAKTLSPTEKREVSGGWDLTWRYSNLLSGFEIGMDMPQKLQPGPLAGEIAMFAPVSLLFFFAVVFLVVTIRQIDLHPMNYAFLAAAFFAFHLLMAYLVDHVSIHVAFVVASIVSVLLVVSYLRLAIGPSFAFREAALAQFTYLVLFSYAFFFKGFTGLAITIGSVLTLFVAMQMTGRVRWTEVFASSDPARLRLP